MTSEKSSPGHSKRGIEVMERVQGTMAKALCHMNYRDRGFSDQTVRVLVEAGFTHPEQLLFLDEKAAAKIPRIGLSRLREIKAYVLRRKDEAIARGETSVFAPVGRFY